VRDCRLDGSQEVNERYRDFASVEAIASTSLNVPSVDTTPSPLTLAAFPARLPCRGLNLELRHATSEALLLLHFVSGHVATVRAFWSTLTGMKSACDFHLPEMVLAKVRIEGRTVTNVEKPEETP
jgi:hypothetical protein